jgi:predicted ATPase
MAHLTKALELHHKIPAGESGNDRRPDRELEILLAMGPAQMIVKGYAHAEVGQLWDRAHQLAEELGADAHKFHIAWNLWLHNQMSGKLEQASIWSEIVIRLADASDDEEYKLQARHAAWTTALVRGQLAATVTHAEMGTAIYEPDRHHHCTYSYAGHDPGVCAHQNMATALSLQGFHDQALSKVKQAIELANQVGHGPSITIARASSCITLYQWRKPEELLESAQQAIAAADQYGPANFRAYGLVFRGWAMAVLGQGQKSLEDIEAAKRIGAAARLPGYLLVQGEVHLLFGELDRALSAVDEALTLIKMGVEKTYWADVTRLKAEILLAQSTEHGAVAEGLFQEALEIAAEQGARLFELRSVVGLARHRRNQGRTAEAHDLIRLIYEQFTDGFDTADLQAARILLNELS